MPKILIIEDAEPLRNDIMEMLTFEEYEVIGAENGKIGVDKALVYEPDLIICDIMMPELDGYGVLNLLRKNENTVMTPFIFLTAKTDRVDQRRGMNLGAQDFVTKPFVAEELLDTIRTRIGERARLKDAIDKRVGGIAVNIITALPHELRTPLNTVIGFSDMLIAEAENLDADTVIEWSRHINLAGQRLYRLVENYLVYVKLELALSQDSEKTLMRTHKLEHPESVVSLHTVHKISQAERDADLKLELSHDVPVRIQDYDLGKIVDELVDNAIKFSRMGDIIQVKTSSTDDYYIVSVSDSGHGMTQAQINNVGAFNQFDRWLYEHQGSGLGLIIVKRLSDIYEGKMEIDSEPGEGTTATVKLPVVQ